MIEKLKGKRLVIGGKSMGGRIASLVAGYKLSPKIRVAWMPDGDHDSKP